MGVWPHAGGATGRLTGGCPRCYQRLAREKGDDVISRDIFLRSSRTAVGLAWIGLGVCVPGPAAGQSSDPVDDLLQHVERYTGSNPLECGRHLLVQHERRWVAADEAALQKSVECGVAAVSTRRAFWTFKQNQGIDSWIASGVLGTDNGVMYRFAYDSAPCGGPGCPSRISFERCDKPMAATSSNRRSEFRCVK